VIGYWILEFVWLLFLARLAEQGEAGILVISLL